MNAHALEVLEFERLRELLADGAASDLGLEAIAQLQPVPDRDLAERWLRETSEARRVLDDGEDIPLAGLHDLRDLVKQLGIGAVATAGDLLGVAQTLRCIERVKRFFTAREHLPLLQETAAQLITLPALADELERCITDDGEVGDNASPELRKARIQIRQVQGRLQETLRRLLGTLAGDSAVQDATVTIRQGRYCVPIKASHQHQFQGIIHDRSASGQTVFMEPAEVVRLNNDLRDAQLSEREEVQRILRELCEAVAAERGALELDLRLMQSFDLTRAKGRLSARLDAVEPVLDAQCRFDVKQARHPLLVVQLGRQTVPVDLRLGYEFNTLLITGPNTGGKTVSLKTLGLLCLMAQAGMHIPADPGSRLSACRDVYADIGDEQSLEQSLSTFGAHLKQIVSILREARAGDLVLVDEMGAGTDPTEGAALAEAVLTTLHERDCRVVATTHHGSLKKFAYETEGVENASVEFDARSLAPTYRLLIGIPGASHAFDIAARYGVPPEVVALARDLLPEEHHEAAEMIAEMQSTRQRLDREAREAEHEAAKASHQRRELEKERQRLRELEQQIRDEAHREAARLLEQVQSQADQILADLRRSEREGKQTEGARQRLKSLREQERAGRRTTVTRTTAVPTPDADDPLRLGDVVEVVKLGARGKVTAIEEDVVEVQAGAMRMTLSPDEVVRVQRATPAVTAPARKAVAGSASPDLELHLRGQTIDEALLNLDRYLDQALLANLPEVRIVHGKGTGALKRAVHEYLRHHPYVKGYQHPPENQGGGGVTVAKLDG